MEKLIILDGHNLLFRMFYGIPGSIKNTKSEEIRGVVGFLASIKKLIKQFETSKLLAVFDSETSLSDKMEIDSNYKQNRPDYGHLPTDENPFSQLPYIYQILTYLGIPYCEATNAEADDYIASICEKFKHDYHCIIVSTDKDFFQLVSDYISVYNPMSKMLYTPEKVYDRFQVTPNQIIDYKVLVGDPSDNIKGVPSIGPKTAVKILSLGSLEDIMKSEQKTDEHIYNILKDHQESIIRDRKLITMNRHVNIEFSLEYEISKEIIKNTFDILRECEVL